MGQVLYLYAKVTVEAVTDFFCHCEPEGRRNPFYFPCREQGLFERSVL
jgi:hypothetical protein